MPSMIEYFHNELKRLDCPTACLIKTKNGYVYVTDDDTLELAKQLLDLVPKDLMEKA